MGRFLGLLAVAVLVLGACAPVKNRISTPSARLLGAELLELDPFADRLVLRLDLELTNPNPYELPLLASELRVRLGDLDSRAILPALTLPAQGQARTSVRVEAPVGRSAGTAARLLAGESLPLVLTARLRVDALGQGIWLGPYPLLRDRVRFSVQLAPPEVEPVSAEIALGPGALEFRLRYRARNSLPVGFRVEGSLVARVGGYILGEAPVALRLPPQGEEEGELVLRLPLSALPGAAGALSRGAPYELSGELRVKVPGVLERNFRIRLAGVAR